MASVDMYDIYPADDQRYPASDAIYDPVLLDPAGRAVDTWRENDPYDERMPRDEYDEQKYLLQVELLKFQSWATQVGGKHVILFEGRDAAGLVQPRRRRARHGVCRRA
jgi:polyphosphate kinase 2 (PPK2 family)